MKLRKRFIVDKKLQYSIITKNLLLLALTFAMIAAVLFAWEKYQTRQGFLIRLPQNSTVNSWARENSITVGSAEYMRQFIKMAKVYTFFDLLWKPLALVLFLNALILVAASMYFSNSIAGPIHRLKAVLKKRLEGGETETVHFRKNDAFGELAELVNKVLEKETGNTGVITNLKE